MKTLKILTVTLIVLLAFASAGYAGTADDPNSDADALLASLAKSSLDLQYKVLVSGLEGEGPLSQSPSVERSKAEESLLKRDLALRYQIAYDGYSTELTVDDIQIVDTVATLRATEYTVLYIQGDLGAQAPKTTEYVYQHVFHFVKVGEQWVLQADELINLPGPVKPSPEEELVPIENEAEALQVVIDQDRPIELTLGDDAQALMIPQSPTQAQATISKSRIVAYAYVYWKNYNKSYRNFNNSGSRGGDCTNFVSQAVRYGGWPDVSGWYKSSGAWWYNWLNQSWTWINAHYWWWFTYNRPRGSLVRYFSDLNPGDVLQADFDKDGYIDHTMIVTSKDRWGNVYLTYHSNDTKDRPWWELYNAGGNFYGWRLGTSVN